MSPATAPPRDARAFRLLRLDVATGAMAAGDVDDLHTALRSGDLLVVNDSATLPGSLWGCLADGTPLEVRLAGAQPDGAFAAVLFGTGTWRQATEDRGAPPAVRVGAALIFGDLVATVTEVDAELPRLVRLRFDRDGTALWDALYRLGAPIQYSYLDDPLDVWDVQTPLAGRPWSVEPPSAGLCLRWELIRDLRRRGVAVARITHGAGLSSTGDPRLDARLPLAERSDVPAATVTAIGATKAQGRRVIAAGTTVVRALESAAPDGHLQPATGWTHLRLGPTTPTRVVDGLLTGMHEEGTSHFDLLTALAPTATLRRAVAAATAHGFRGHEFGDLMLVA
ncbi:MAG: S-adenosylmethionine:tRNA ribosyltransferase-isomerase [Planctomycetota bacterium]